jgi:hypothetical protein
LPRELAEPPVHLMKNEATLSTPTRLPPAALRFSKPVRNALSTARYRSSEKMSVTLTLYLRPS